MKQSIQIKRSTALILALLLALLFGGVTKCLASWDYGNGRHGPYVLPSSMTIEQLYLAVKLPSDPPQYDPANTNAIPNFQTLVIPSGLTLTANPWDGGSGGRIVFKVQGTLAITPNASISVNGSGYRGGSTAQQGESWAGSQANFPGANYGGGGAGVYHSVSGAGVYLPAGGGGYGSTGSPANNNTGGGSGGEVYGTPLLDTPYLGSGGGGSIGTGGNGGGAIAINAGDLQVAGHILANGADGQYPQLGSISGSGGGSGGSILLRVATGSLGINNITANGGSGGNGTNFGGSRGGDGGSGRICVQFAESFTGTTSPAVSTYFDGSSDYETVITVQPLTQSNFLGSNMVFNVGVSGIAPFAFQWYFGDAPIPEATNQTLLLAGLSFTNQGTYSVTISNLVTTLASSNAFLTILDPRTPLGDGIPNWWKEEYGLSTNDPTLAAKYPAGDQLTYLEKYLYRLNPQTNDTDGDGLTDYAEVFVYHSNPLSTDTAGDGIPDGWKATNGLNPSANVADNQVGVTGVTYLQIYQYDTGNPNHQLDPRNPFFVPGTSIYEALNNGKHTNHFYYDHEDRLVGAEYSRGDSIAYQYDGNGNLTRQTVLSRASETNGLPVLWLWLNGLTNRPGVAYEDSSGNGWDNYQEWLTGLNPNNSNDVPTLLNNPGTNIARLTLPFTASDFVVVGGNLDGLPGDEIVVGGDGNPGTNMNALFILTQTATNWSTQQVSVGSFGITSIAVGQPTNRLRACFKNGQFILTQAV